MIQYVDDGDRAIFDGLSFRRDKRTGYYLNRKTQTRLHVYVWEFYNGKIPKGYHIHHIDMNKDNNEIENLVMLSASEHEKLHASLWTDERREKARKNVLEKAVPASKAWHGSEEGRKWHSEHAKKVFGNMDFLDYECTFCGKAFSSRKRYKETDNRFCCNACKSAYRREIGVDDIEKTCQTCGRTYKENKYRKTRECPLCKSKKRRGGRV